MSDRPGSICPADGRPLEPVVWTDPADVNAVVARAREAQRRWSDTSFEQRALKAHALARLILKRREKAMDLLEQEMGRARADSLLGELAFVVDYAKGAVITAKKALKPEKLRLNPVNFPGKRGVIEMVPRGVIGIIEPWNYPLLQFYKPLFPALLAGNTVVLKPSEHTPRTGAWLAALCAEVYGPDVVSLVQGDGAVGAALVDADVDAIVFCGSVATGRKIAARCGERLIPCSVELGGKDAAIVLDDCDLDRTVAGITQWSMHNAGQDCSSIERVYVEEAIAPAFVERLGKSVASLHVNPDGHGDIGPLQNAAQLEIVKAQVADAVEKGARVVVGGEPTGSGLGFQPTVLDNCTDDMRVITEETFGPVAAVVRVADAEEAVQRANDCPYGLNASVWTKNLKTGERLARRLDVGIALVNNHSFVGSIPQVPWTGTKATGFGVAGSKHAFHTFARPRTLVVDKSKKPDVFWKPADANLSKLGEAASKLALGSLMEVFTLIPLLGKRTRAIREMSGGDDKK